MTETGDAMLGELGVLDDTATLKKIGMNTVALIVLPLYLLAKWSTCTTKPDLSNDAETLRSPDNQGEPPQVFFLYSAF